MTRGSESVHRVYLGALALIGFSLAYLRRAMLALVVIARADLLGSFVDNLESCCTAWRRAAQSPQQAAS